MWVLTMKSNGYVIFAIILNANVSNRHSDGRRSGRY